MKKQPPLPKHTKTLFETEGRKATSCYSNTGLRPVFCIRKIEMTNIRKAEPNGPHDLSEG
ncbi:hypothetical protein SAMN05216327_111209 [Dyadobacter sp. SG02]|nr:hypothetical protein SAMN05216327_111209 [Dyadobacter sp. SG02]